MEDTVTVIITNYNKSKYLEQSINSVINQTYSSWELVIVDDGSTDNSVNILDKFIKNKKIQIIKLNKNKGVSFCRNLAIRFTNKKYLAFLDSDDFWFKDKLKDQIFFMKKNNYDICYTNYLFLDELKKKEFKVENIVDKLNYQSFLKDTSIATSSLIVTRKSIGLIKFKKIRIIEDYLFKCELLKAGYVAYKLDKILCVYRNIRDGKSANPINNLFYLLYVNSKYNKINFIKNFFISLCVVISSVKRHGFKKYF